MTRPAALSYLAILDRLPVSERIKEIERLMQGPLEPGTLPTLKSEFMNLTDRETTHA